MRSHFLEKQQKNDEDTDRAHIQQTLRRQDELDKNLTQWDIFMGIPHKTVKIPGVQQSKSEDCTKGTPLGLNNDPLEVFSMIEEDGQPVLKITGQVYGGLTTKEEFQNYHLTMQFKWVRKNGRHA